MWVFLYYKIFLFPPLVNNFHLLFFFACHICSLMLACSSLTTQKFDRSRKSARKKFHSTIFYSGAFFVREDDEMSENCETEIPWWQRDGSRWIAMWVQSELIKNSFWIHYQLSRFSSHSHSKRKMENGKFMQIYIATTQKVLHSNEPCRDGFKTLQTRRMNFRLSGLLIGILDESKL